MAHHRAGRVIRKIGLGDLPQIVAMGKRMHAESRYAKFSLSESKLLEFLGRLVEHPDGIAIMSEHGMLLGMVTEHWFGYNRVADQWVLYVEPEYRSRGEAIDLVNQYVEMATTLGAVDIHIENTTGVEGDRTEALFARLGFNRVGGKFVMETI